MIRRSVPIIVLLLSASCTAGTPATTSDDALPGQPASKGEMTDEAKAKATGEAVHFLKKMSDGARAFYKRHDDNFPTGASGSYVAANQLPESSGPTPPLGTCCQDGGECKPRPSLWTTASWQAMEFAISEPHYFSYAFRVKETDGQERYEAIAYGDFDCDGEYSEFVLSGEVITQEIRVASDITKKDPLE